MTSSEVVILLRMTRSQFSQFPAAGLTFLRKLKRNNHREWFLKNKQTYENYVRQPMIELVNALAPEFRHICPQESRRKPQSQPLSYL